MHGKMGKYYLLLGSAMLLSCTSTFTSPRTEIIGRSNVFKKTYRRPEKKRALTPKQKTARAKGKRAKQARKKNRENLVQQLKCIGN